VRQKVSAEAQKMAATQNQAIADAAKKACVDAKVVAAWSLGNGRFGTELAGNLKDTACELGVPTREMVSQISHGTHTSVAWRTRP